MIATKQEVKPISDRAVDRRFKAMVAAEGYVEIDKKAKRRKFVFAGLFVLAMVLVALVATIKLSPLLSAPAGVAATTAPSPARIYGPFIVPKPAIQSTVPKQNAQPKPVIVTVPSVGSSPTNARSTGSSTSHQRSTAPKPSTQPVTKVATGTVAGTIPPISGPPVIPVPPKSGPVPPAPAPPVAKPTPPVLNGPPATGVAPVNPTGGGMSGSQPTDNGSGNGSTGDSNPLTPTGNGNVGDGGPPVAVDS